MKVKEEEGGAIEVVEEEGEREMGKVKVGNGCSIVNIITRP